MVVFLCSYLLVRTDEQTDVLWGGVASNITKVTIEVDFIASSMHEVTCFVSTSN